jgi:hypothetical protein
VHVFKFTKECPTINLQGKMLSKEDFELLYRLAEERLL